MNDTSKPDWVMLGVSFGDKVRVLASTELTEAELASELENYDDLYGGWDFGRTGVRPRYRHTVTAEMRTFVMVEADTYELALAALFGQWTPKPAERAALTGRRELSS